MKPQLAVIRGCVETPQDNGKLVEIITLINGGADYWVGPDDVRWRTDGFDCFAVESLGRPFFAGTTKVWSQWTLVDKRRVFPINDNPGNEAWVTEARKKLKPTEITERGELA